MINDLVDLCQNSAFPRHATSLRVTSDSQVSVHGVFLYDNALTASAPACSLFSRQDRIADTRQCIMSTSGKSDFDL